MEEIETSEIAVMKKNGLYRLGKCYIYYWDDEIWITIGPDWPFNVCMYTILLAILIGFLTVMAPKVGPSLQFAGFFIIMTGLFSYACTALKNPGLILQDYTEAVEQGKISSDHSFCKRCQVVTTSNSEHCDDCDLCVEGLDHHCPVSGKCIAKGNILYFYLFLTAVFAFFIFFVVWIFAVARFQVANQNHK